MKAAEKTQRDSALIADRAKGLSWAKVSKKHGVSVRQAQRIWQDEKQTRLPELTEAEALDVVFESMSRYEQWQNQLAELAEESKGPVKVGAIRAQMDCENRKMELRQATGMLPKHLGKLAVEFDVRFVVRQMIAVLERHEVTPALEADLLATLKPGEN